LWGTRWRWDEEDAIKIAWISEKKIDRSTCKVDGVNLHSGERKTEDNLMGNP